MKLILAGVLAGAFVFSPVATVVSTATLAIDCSDTSSPAARPGGYCDQIDSGTTLSVPVDATPPKPVCAANALLPEDFFLTRGARVTVAAECGECGNLCG